MKKDIHPQYGKAIVTCACGETFETGSTEKEIRVESAQMPSLFYGETKNRRFWWTRCKNSKKEWRKPERKFKTEQNLLCFKLWCSD